MLLTDTDRPFYSNDLPQPPLKLHFAITGVFLFHGHYHIICKGRIPILYLPFAMTPTRAFCLSISSATASSSLVLHFLPVCTSVFLSLSGHLTVYSRTSLVWLTRNSFLMLNGNLAHSFFHKMQRWLNFLVTQTIFSSTQ